MVGWTEEIEAVAEQQSVVLMSSACWEIPGRLCYAADYLLFPYMCSECFLSTY